MLGRPSRGTRKRLEERGVRAKAEVLEISEHGMTVETGNGNHPSAVEIVFDHDTIELDRFASAQEPDATPTDFAGPAVTGIDVADLLSGVQAAAAAATAPSGDPVDRLTRLADCATAAS
jgi:hypothetical protein